MRGCNIPRGTWFAGSILAILRVGATILTQWSGDFVDRPRWTLRETKSEEIVQTKPSKTLPKSRLAQDGIRR
jgi:hypothetical protein